MSVKRLFVVELINEMIVLADSPEAAERFAKRIQRDEAGEPDAQASDMAYYPGDWDSSSIPFGDRDEAEPDRTVEKWIELGAAPEYRTRKKPV